MKTVIVFALLIAAAPLAMAETPACGPDLDAALQAAAAEEARHQQLLYNLGDYLMWVEFDYEEGNMTDAVFEQEMREGEEDYAIGDAALKAAADHHIALKARLAACPETAQP